MSLESAHRSAKKASISSLSDELGQAVTSAEVPSARANAAGVDEHEVTVRMPPPLAATSHGLKRTMAAVPCGERCRSLCVEG